MLGSLGHAPGNHACFGADHRHILRESWQPLPAHRSDRLELFRVDHRRHRRKRNHATGVACPSAARDHGESQFKAALDQRRNFGLIVGRDHDKGILHPPVGGVGHMRDPRHRIKGDVVPRGVPRKAAQYPLAQSGSLRELLLKERHRFSRPAEQLVHLRQRRRLGFPALFDVCEAMMKCLDQERLTLGIVNQVVLQIGIAFNRPYVTKHFVQHARGSAGAPFLAQGTNEFPPPVAKQADHNLAIGIGSVVVGYFPQSGSFPSFPEGVLVGDRNSGIAVPKPWRGLWHGLAQVEVRLRFDTGHRIHLPIVMRRRIHAACPQGPGG